MQHIQTLIQEVIRSLYDSEFTPEITPAPKPELGEYCINVFPLAKDAKIAPPIIAESISTELAKYGEIFRGTSATGGYVNFFLADSVWIGLFATLEEPQVRETQDTSIIVDYIGANAGKPLHIGHICTPSIGQVICNVYRHLGYRVIGDSHFGDWGGIFGKLIYVWENITILSRLDDSKYGTYKTLMEAGTELWKNEQLKKYGVDFLLDLYKAFHITLPSIEGDGITADDDLGARLEFQYLSGVGIDLSNSEELKHHEENVELWKKFTALSILEIETKLGLLNVHATYNIGESFYEGLGLPRPNDEDYPNIEFNMKQIVEELCNNPELNGMVKRNDDGSVGVIFPEESKLPSCILQKKDGTGLYLTSDLAAIKYRLTNGWNPSKIIYSVDVRQQLHLRQAFAIAKAAWPELIGGVELFHAYNGFIKLKEGAMSTRHGTVIFLEALIEEGFEKTKEVLEKKGQSFPNKTDEEKAQIINAISIGAIKYSYLTQDREKDVVFDWDKALNFEGHSGPYIQYAYVRAKKITELGGENNIRDDEGLMLSAYDKALIQVLSRFEEALDMTARTYKPHHLALYAYDLAGEFNSFYVHTPKILEEENKNLKQFRLALVEKTAKTLEKSLDLLGIQMPSEM